MLLVENMPYDISRNADGTYKVAVKETGRVLAYDTAVPYKVIYAVEASIARRNKRKYPERIASRKVKAVSMSRRTTTKRRTTAKRRTTTKRRTPTKKRRTTTKKRRTTTRAKSPCRHTRKRV